jgi:hypothetical protein
VPAAAWVSAIAAADWRNERLCMKIPEHNGRQNGASSANLMGSSRPVT